MHDLLNNIQIEENVRELYFQIKREYHKLAGDRGMIIDDEEPCELCYHFYA